MYGAEFRERDSAFVVHRDKEMIFMQRIWGLSEAHEGTYCSVLGIQLVAEGSASNQRGLGIAITKVRHNNAEGSAFQLNQKNDWL